ncbi:MAG: DUF5680 domain-containing protein [bacterium]|nr:DUF5680 domain-containing protein [bacterium]
MNIDDIRRFLVKANRNGYGNESVKEANEADGSHTIIYSDGDWLFHDNFFGGEPFGGREVISYKDKPVWMMVYYGYVSELSLQKEVYAFLKKALLNFPEDMPYRGPKELIEGDRQYNNSVTGEFDSFSGEESISFRSRSVYQAGYQGGLIDKE